MTIKLPVDVNTLDDETLSLLIDESKKALGERNKYAPFVGEIIEVTDDDEWRLERATSTVGSKIRATVGGGGCAEWNHYRRLDPTRILQFRDHEPGPCPCPDEEWVHVMWKSGAVATMKINDLTESNWASGAIIRWCPAVGVE